MVAVAVFRRRRAGSRCDCVSCSAPGLGRRRATERCSIVNGLWRVYVQSVLAFQYAPCVLIRPPSFTPFPSLPFHHHSHSYRPFAAHWTLLPSRIFPPSLFFRSAVAAHQPQSATSRPAFRSCGVPLRRGRHGGEVQRSREHLPHCGDSPEDRGAPAAQASSGRSMPHSQSHLVYS